MVPMDLLPKGLSPNRLSPGLPKGLGLKNFGNDYSYPTPILEFGNVSSL